MALPVKDTYAYKEGIDESMRVREDGEEMIFYADVNEKTPGDWLVTLFKELSEECLSEHWP